MKIRRYLCWQLPFCGPVGGSRPAFAAGSEAGKARVSPLAGMAQNRPANAQTRPANTQNRNNVVADRDGNVYQRDANNNWSQRSGNQWQAPTNANTQDLDRQMQSRDRGQTRNASYNQMNRGGNIGGGARAGGGQEKVNEP